MTFKEQLVSDIIPRLEAMLLKEEQHHSWIYEHWDGSDEAFDFFYNAAEQSKKYIAHYKERLQQYAEYAEKL